jgi:hypothetical protein
MNQEQFDKGIEGMREMSMSAREKAAMLKSIFDAPVESPYVRLFNISFFASRQAMAMAFSLLLVLFTGTAAYAAERSVPGDALYLIKTEVFEPIVGRFKLKPENQLAWEAEKIERRISEVEKLVSENKLDEEKVRGLEKKIEKASAAFAIVAERAASSTASTTAAHKVKVEKLKNDLIEKIGEKKEESAKRLKDAAVKGLDIKDGKRESAKGNK